MEISIKDREDNTKNIWLDLEEWQLNSDWYEWCERYFPYDRSKLPLEHQFEQWRKRVKGR